MATTSIDPELAAAVQLGVATNRFSTTTRVRLIEASSPDLISDEGELDDEALSKRLEIIKDEKRSKSVRVWSFFIPWAVHDKQLAITPGSLLRICTEFGVSALFLDGLFAYDYATRSGDGLFFHRDETWNYSKLDLFYRCPCWSATSGRSYISTTYEFSTKVTANLCFNLSPYQMPLAEQSSIKPMQYFPEEPMLFHILLASQNLKSLDKETSKLRVHLLQDENGQFNGNPKAKTENLHMLAQRLHINVENLTDFEELMVFLIRASERIRVAINPTSVIEVTNEVDMLSYLLSKGRHSKRWVANHRDRANIRINLAFHLSTQVDNDINLRIATDTATIARDAQRDSSSMITIAAVTMFFLPGTFISAVFSMTFFNFQQDDSGNQQFQVSNKWWYFIAFTVPLTSAVFLVWIAWQKWRFRNLAEEDMNSAEKVRQDIRG